jgi:hypothetical protein
MEREEKHDIMEKICLISVGCLQDGALCSTAGRLDAAQFAAAMRNQLRQYSGRRISDFLYHGNAREADKTQARLPLTTLTCVCIRHILRIQGP